MGKVGGICEQVIWGGRAFIHIHKRWSYKWCLRREEFGLETNHARSTAGYSVALLMPPF